MEVLPDAAEVDERLDPEAPAAVGRADAREQEQSRRLDRAGADDDLVPRPRQLERASARELDADAARALEDQATGAGGRVQRELRAVEHGPQERLGDAVAPAVPDRQLAEADAVELGAVVVRR